MDVFEAIKTRRSVRSYESKDVEEKKLRKILEAARLAPSASNRQEWRFVVVKDGETRKKLSRAAKGQKMVSEAPVVIACCAETDGHLMTCGQACYPIDVAIAIDHMTLTAVEEGLGTCWVGAFFEEEVKRILGIPEDVKVVELLAVGYPKNPAEKAKKSRLDIDHIVKMERWS
ncbi:MAG: nitroreductase family protein [Elusimicrobia bacterium]|nr:nitroreductase family protein [Elusimicrobiota bacterium]